MFSIRKLTVFLSCLMVFTSTSFPVTKLWQEPIATSRSWATATWNPAGLPTTADLATLYVRELFAQPVVDTNLINNPCGRLNVGYTSAAFSQLTTLTIAPGGYLYVAPATDSTGLISSSISGSRGNIVISGGKLEIMAGKSNVFGYLDKSQITITDGILQLDEGTINSFGGKNAGSAGGNSDCNLVVTGGKLLQLGTSSGLYLSNFDNGYGTCTFNIDGGDVNTCASMVIANQVYNSAVGLGSRGHGPGKATINLNSGTLSCYTMYVGGSPENQVVINQNGGKFVNTFWARIPSQDTGNSIWNLKGGTATFRTLYFEQKAGTSVFNVDGGVLKIYGVNDYTLTSTMPIDSTEVLRSYVGTKIISDSGNDKIVILYDFVTGYNIVKTAGDLAYNPTPIFGDPNFNAAIGTLTWNAPIVVNNPGSLQYDVYVGTTPDLAGITAVRVSSESINQRLINNQTYYWRVDVVDGGVVRTGDVWYFTARCSLPRHYGDVNGDCAVNNLDLAEMANDWLNCTIPDGAGCTSL